MKQEPFTITVRSNRLDGVLSWDVPEARKAVLLLHPHPLYGGDMDDHVLSALEAVFLSLGYVSLRFNFRGAHGDRASFCGTLGAVEDAEVAYSLLKSRRRFDLLGIAGYSLGGSVALRLGMTHAVDFLVALSASASLLSEGDWTPGSLVPAHSLLFHGSSDKVVPCVDMKEIARILDGSAVVAVTLDNEGHFYTESLEIVCDKLRSFIRTVEERAMGGKQT